LGAFCATVALLLPLVAAPRLAVLPAELRQTWTLTDPAGTYLDTTHWRTREDVEVVRSTDLVGAPVPGEPDLLALAVTTDTGSPLGPIGHLEHRTVVDRATGWTVDCCGADTTGRSGRVGLWPPGAEEAEFPFRDPDRAGRRGRVGLGRPGAAEAEFRLRDHDTGAAPRMRLDGADEVGGLAVHRYTQQVPPTRVPGSVRDVPASVLDLDGGGTVRAERW